MSEVLASLSQAMADTVNTAGAGVVRVEARRRLPASGVLWGDGLIVTSHHVVTRDENIQIGLPNGEKVSATLVGRDPSTDVAILRADVKGLPAPAWAEADNLRVGHVVLALGRPGENVLATMGIISALEKDWRSPAGGQMDYFVQTDVVMYPGFSGGPLVDASGQIIGINTSALMQGVSLTIPTATIRTVADSLVKHGKIRRGYLGVGAQAVRLPENLAKELHQESGLMLVSVESNSPAEKGGLVMGDTIVHLDNQPVRQLEELLALLSGSRVGSNVTVKVLRGGQLADVNVTIDEK
jgi:S1-C subfamily serine protease